MALKQGARMNRVAIVSDSEKTVTLNDVENNTGLVGITFNLVRPEVVLSPSFKDLVMTIKESSSTEFTEEEISKLLSRPRETPAKLAYIIVSKTRGTILGFVLDNKMQPLIIPRHAGGVDCLIEVMTDIESDEASYYVDCTNTRVFTPDQIGNT